MKKETSFKKFMCCADPYKEDHLTIVKSKDEFIFEINESGEGSECVISTSDISGMIEYLQSHAKGN